MAVDLSVAGLASGFDWKSLVSQLADAERTPETRLRTDQSDLATIGTAYDSIKTEMTVLSGKVNTLKDPTFFDSRGVTSSDTTTATAAAASGTANGTYKFTFTQLATVASQVGTSDNGQKLSATDDLGALLVGNVPTAQAITGGTFTVNNRQITIATSDTLQSVLEQINTQTGGDVTASYDSATDSITLHSATSGEVVLGSASDTSNFLQATKLVNNGTATITSSSSLGAVRSTGALANANFATAITGGSNGSFSINGVSINYDVSADSVQDVIGKINASTAGIVASYDSVNDRFTLTNKATGDVGITLQDTSGNFLQATGLTGGTLQHGKNLLYSVNGGGQLVSQTNMITQDSSGITGLTVNALTEGGTATITVATDTAKIKSAITDFLSEYNKVQSLIDTQTASSTSADGKVTAGTLASESDASELASKLRSIAFSSTSGNVLKGLSDLGIDTSGTDNSLTLVDESSLDNALANNINGVKSLFTDATTGVATQLDTYLTHTVGEDGTLVTKENHLTKQISDIDTQIADLERVVQADSQRLTDSFTAMETAEANINQQLQYLTKSGL